MKGRTIIRGDNAYSNIYYIGHNIIICVIKFQQKMSDFKKNFSERFKKALDGRSQSAVSKRIGYSQALISKYLTGNIPDAFTFLEKLAKEYQIDLHWLITGDLSPKTKELESNYYQALEKIITQKP